MYPPASGGGIHRKNGVAVKGGDIMRIQVEIDAGCREPEIIIRTNEMTDEIGELVQRLSASQQKLLAGFVDDSVQLIDTPEIVRFYSADKKVLAETKTQRLVIRLRLYELEERLDKTLFVRISNSEIVNMKAIKKLDLSFAGTISITLSNGATTYVSRRYVARLKQILGI
jgi:DNA-binding LytR/AlgR family response regulator